MREIEPKFDRFEIAHVRAGHWIAGDPAGTGIAGLGETRGTAREYKNRGNKAKKWLKTKDIIFLNAADQGPLRANRHKSGPEASKEHPNLGERGQAPASQGEAGQVTKSRLHEIRVCMPSADARPETARTRTLPLYSLSARR